MFNFNKKRISVFICIIAVFITLFCITVSADEHRWTEWITDVQPTCTIDGHMYRVCDLYPGYEHIEEKTIPKLGHSYAVKTENPTCVSREKKIYTCTRCNSTYTEEFGERSHHQYIESVTKEASCEVEGTKTFTCSNCGESYTETILPKGHNYGEWITEKTATESEEGVKIRVCANDNTHVIKEVIPRLQPKASNVVPKQNNRRINKWDVILTSINISIVWLFAIILYPLFMVLLWAKQKRKNKIKEVVKFNEAK